MRSSNELVLDISDATVDTSSSAIPASQMLSVSAQIVSNTSSGISGTVKLQFSNDPQQPVDGGASPSNWSDITSATVTVNAAGVFAIQKTEVCANWIRVVYSDTSSTDGTVKVRLNSLAL